MLNRFQIILAAFLSVAVVGAASFCVIEDAAHAAEMESHGNPDHHQHSEKSKDNTSLFHQDDEHDICCETFLAYISTAKSATQPAPRLSKRMPFNLQAEISKIPLTPFVNLFPGVKHDFSNHQGHRYALSNPPTGPPFI
jgi:hypothetical protein